MCVYYNGYAEGKKTLDVENLDVENAMGKEDDQKMNSKIGSSALQIDGLKDHDDLMDVVKHKVDNLLADGADRAVAAGEVVGAKAFKSHAHFRGPCISNYLGFQSPAGGVCVCVCVCVCVFACLCVSVCYT